jgi:hypothetical protein
MIPNEDTTDGQWQGWWLEKTGDIESLAVFSSFYSDLVQHPTKTDGLSKSNFRETLSLILGWTPDAESRHKCGLPTASFERETLH